MTGPQHTPCGRAREEAALALLAGRPADPGAAAHLAGCPECRREVDRLAPLPGLLELVRDPALRPGDQPPDEELLDRLLVRAGRRHRTRRYVLLAAAAAVLVPSGLLAAHEVAELRAPGPSAASAPPAAVVGKAEDPATGAWMTVELRAAGAGSDLVVSVGGLPASVRCRLVAVSRSGSTDVAGSWTSTAPDTRTLHGSLPLARQEITAIQVVDDSTGQVLLPVRLA